jgi:hypothetical protein
MNRRHQAQYPGAFFGLVGLVLAVEAFVATHEHSYVRPEQWDWQYRGRAAARNLERYQVLCFGDSQVKGGVQPRLIEARIGKAAYSLAPSGGTPATSYFLLRRALRAGAKPSLVVVDYHRDIMAKRPRDQATAPQWVELLNPREILELAITSRDLEFGAEMILARFLPSTRNREGLRSHITSRLRNERSPWNAVRQVLHRNWRINGGSQAIPTNAAFKDLEMRPGVPDPAATWRVDSGAQHYINAFFTLARSRGIQVAWLLPPVSPGYQLILDRGKGDGRFIDFAHRMTARHDNVVLVDGRHSGYPSDVFNDVAHLDLRGASALSDQLASLVDDILRARPPITARSVDLPLYQPRASACGVEEVIQSAAALGIPLENLATRR